MPNKQSNPGRPEKVDEQEVVKRLLEFFPTIKPAQIVHLIEPIRKLSLRSVQRWKSIHDNKQE